MIRSSKVSLKFANSGKKDALSGFLTAYRDVVERAVDILWGMDHVPHLLPKDLTRDIGNQLGTTLSARAVQCACKQASAIVRSTRDKQDKRLYVINQLIAENQLVNARKLQKVYDRVAAGKPEIKRVNPELDSRFVTVQFESSNSFEGWLTLGSLGNRLRIVLPFKRTCHLNGLLEKGVPRNGVRISQDSATFMFDIPDPPPVAEGITLGVDVGQTNAIATSGSFVSCPNEHGHDLITIQATLSRRKKGSKGFRRAVAHRANYINWTINQLDLTGVKQVNRENIKYLRRCRKSSRMLSHWTYTEIFDKLDSFCAEQGVPVLKKDPTYTSQRCSNEGCGWTCKRNRQGKQFRCTRCCFALDADLNAARNIALTLPAISRKQRLKHPSRHGFYWRALEQEPIVPAVQEPVCPN